MRRPELLLLQLRGTAHAPLADAHVFGPDGAVRSGDFSGCAAICDPMTIAAYRRLHAVRGQPHPRRADRSARRDVSPARAAADVRRRAAESDAVEQQTRASISSACVSIIASSSATRSSARFSTFDADEVQPFGTSSLQETLVPGLRPHARHAAPERRRQPHARRSAPSVLNELRFGWMRVDGGQVSENRGVDFAAQVGLQGVTSDPRDVGYPQISTRGLYSTFGDPTSFTYRNNQHVELYDNVIVDRGAHRLKFGGYYFHLQLQAGATGQRARRLHVYRPVHRERLRRFPARLSDVRGHRYRPRRRERPDQLVAPVRPGRLAGPRATSRSTSGCATNTTSTCATWTTGSRRWTRRAGWTLRDRERRERDHQRRRRRRCCR